MNFPSAINSYFEFELVEKESLLESGTFLLRLTFLLLSPTPHNISPHQPQGPAPQVPQ